MLQIANAFFKLPGDYLLPHETEISGFQSRLAERLSPPVGSSIAEQFMDGEEGPYDWSIHDCVAQWWRPNFETFMYPFIPAHVTRPKECKKMYLIQLPKKSTSPFSFS
jgi:cleavage and polyadenylation specificity factor subunit 5